VARHRLHIVHTASRPTTTVSLLVLALSTSGCNLEVKRPTRGSGLEIMVASHASKSITHRRLANDESRGNKIKNNQSILLKRRTATMTKCFNINGSTTIVYNNCTTTDDLRRRRRHHNSNARTITLHNNIIVVI